MIVPTHDDLALWRAQEAIANRDNTHAGFRQGGWTHLMRGGYRLADIEVAAALVFAFRSLREEFAT